MLIADARMTGAMKSRKMINELSSQNNGGTLLETMRTLLSTETTITNNRSRNQKSDPKNWFLQQGTMSTFLQWCPVHMRKGKKERAILFPTFLWGHSLTSTVSHS